MTPPANHDTPLIADRRPAGSPFVPSASGEAAISLGSALSTVSPAFFEGPMAGTTPNSSNIQRVDKGVVSTVYMDIHPEYEYWRPDWQKIRDVLAGQREVKRKQGVYLPKMPGADVDDYRIYLDRAVFYNMTGQTLNGMLGQVFRREPVVRNLPDSFKNAINTFAKDGSSHAQFTKTVMGEQIGLGRFGVLVDAPASASRRAPKSYAVGYAAENIIDWDIADVDGVHQPTRVVLREFVRDADAYQPPAAMTSAQARKLRRQGLSGAPKPLRQQGGQTYTTLFRELVLEPDANGELVYRQYLYKDDPNTAPISAVTPMIRGQVLRFIPFKFFGATSNNGDVEKSPLLDIVELNLSHYRTYADLESGRMYTALPVYYAPGNDGDGATEYKIGPNRVWEVPMGGEPGIVEYTGQGLQALENALSTKEAQIAAIGGRLMPGRAKSVSESNNQTMLREANEQSLLLNVIQAAEAGMTDVVRWWLMWRDVPLSETEALRYEINQDFLSTPIGAREIRAIQMLYNDGMLTVELLYEFYRKAELCPSSMTLDEFKTQLADPSSFINNPNAQARQRGYDDRGQELEQVRVAREQAIEDRRLENEDRRVEIEERKLEIAEAVGSTTVSATRKLGDPEQLAPSKQEARQLDIQEEGQKSQAKAALVAAKQPKVAAPAPAATPKK